MMAAGLSLSRFGKKGQFYLLAAIMLITVLWASLPSSSEETIVRDTFDLLRENFVSESQQVINHALFAGKNVSELYQDFVTDFLVYARKRQVDFGVVYILRTSSGIEVGNFIGSDVEVEVHGVVSVLSDNSVSVFEPADGIVIYYKDVPFRFSFNNEPVQFKALFRQAS